MAITTDLHESFWSILHDYGFCFLDSKDIIFTFIGEILMSENTGISRQLTTSIDQ